MSFLWWQSPVWGMEDKQEMQIIIKNLKKIKNLTFDLPQRGVWLLTGLNGSGKTSLLAALFRIGSSNAFRKYYRTSSLNNRCDDFDDTKITYSVNGRDVTYSYGGKRWRGKPSRNTNLFQDFGYDDVVFIGADSSRIEPFQDEINYHSVRNASTDIKDLMRAILHDQKWDNLKYVNTRRGTGNDAYLVPYQYRSRTYYYSEKNFSLGELSIFKLAKQLANISDNSLVLIDEIEMALHPQAQVRLLRKLNEIAITKNLTIIFSTHSSTLIKTHPRNKILFLKETSEAGNYEIQQDIYPAQILGELAFDDELGLDFLFYVEDPQAKMLLHQIIGYYFSNQPIGNRNHPLYKIIYVGGANEVVKMLDNSSQIFPNFIKRFAFLDADVETDIVPNIRDADLLTLYTADNVKYLPCTPEIGIMEMLERDNGGYIQTDVSSCFPGHNLNIETILMSIEYTQCNSPKLRKQAKDKISCVVDKIKRITGESENSISSSLYKIYSEKRYANHIEDLNRLLAQIFNS